MSGDPILGARLRASRECAGLTLDQVGKVAGYSASQMSNIEGGRKRIFPHVPLAYERAIRAATDMRRRDVVSGVAGALIAPQATSDILLKGFTSALGDTPGDDDWEQQLAELGRSYMTDGASVVQQQLAADLSVLQHSADNDRMWSVAAREMAIWAKTTASPDEALDWYQLAGVAANRSNDVDAEVWVAGRAALALGYEGAATPMAMFYADKAITLAGDRVTPGLLNAYMGKAHALATLSRPDEARETWDQTQRVYDTLAPGDEITDFNYPYWRFAVVGSLLHARLGDATAEQWQADVERYRPPEMVRFVTHVELHKGLMMARSGDYAGGVAYGQAALDALPVEKRSQSLYLMLDEIKRR
jgi:transcriptional regulator with XRE-family HTH domain